MTSLHFAAWAGNARIIHQLVRIKGFDPDEADADGWTALHFACVGGHAAAVEALLALGATANARTRYGGNTPAMLGGEWGLAGGELGPAYAPAATLPPTLSPCGVLQQLQQPVAFRPLSLA